MFIFFQGSSLIALNFPLPQKASLRSSPPSPAWPDCPQHGNTAPARGGMGLPLPGLSPSLFSQTGRKSCDFYFYFFFQRLNLGWCCATTSPFLLSSPCSSPGTSCWLPAEMLQCTRACWRYRIIHYAMKCFGPSFLNSLPWAIFFKDACTYRGLFSNTAFFLTDAFQIDDIF